MAENIIFTKQSDGTWQGSFTSTGTRTVLQVVREENAPLFLKISADNGLHNVIYQPIKDYKDQILSIDIAEGALITVVSHSAVTKASYIASALDYYTKEEIDEMVVDSVKFKGWFGSSSALSAAYPSPNVGDYAYIKGASASDPAAIYECATAGTWSDSGRAVDTSSVQTFETLEQVNDVSIVNDLTTGGLHDILSAEQGKKIGDEIYDTFNFVDVVGIQENKYYNTNDNPLNVNPLNSNGNGCIRIECNSGDVFRLFGAGANSKYKAFYTWTNSSRNQLERYSSAIDCRENGLVITAPENSAYLYINFLNYNNITDKVQKQVVATNGLKTRITNLENQIRPILSQKNIVVFGDSLSEYKYNNKGWCDYAAEISEANFINVAIGGTQIRQRRALITLFDSNKTYNVGDWVYYKPSTQMNCYECVAEHSGAWHDDDFDEVDYNYYIYSPLDIVNLVKAATNTDIDVYADRFVNQEAAIECVKDHNSDDNTAIMNRLKSIDWSTVDAVVCMAGGNDFNELKYGTSGSTDINKTFGAINEIIRMLNSTYKNIPIYLVTSTIRWFNYSSGSGVDSDWCDVYVPSGGTLTFKEFVVAIINEGKNNHIPVIDLYNELGWNKWNFSNFFTNSDGTHPYKGFRQIAEKIVSFIISNKVF